MTVMISDRSGATLASMFVDDTRAARGAEAFLDHFDLRPRGRDRQTLEAIGEAFSRLPYENLSKLLRKHAPPEHREGRHHEGQRRSPLEVVEEHLALGAGGTCFALSRLFAAVLARLGYRSRVALCDTAHQDDGHCALLVEGDAGETLLLDPGYLLHQPLSLGDARAASGRAGAPELRRLDADRYELSTYGRRRYTLKLDEVSEVRFEAVWDASFDWTMMNGVHVCAPDEAGGYAYLNGHKLRIQGSADKRTVNIRGQEAEALAQRFGLATELVEQAYALVAAAKASGERP